MTDNQIAYGIILEDDILFCSNKEKNTTLEIILFVEKLLGSFNPKHSWRLNNIYLKSSSKEKVRMIIRHFITKNNENLFFIVSGIFNEDSREIRNMLGEFFEKIKIYYDNAEILKTASKKPIFREITKILTSYLSDKYTPLLKEEKIKQEIKTISANKILYGGISTQGLPIISQLYDKTLLNNLNREQNAENIDLYTSSFSAQLATIEMNTLIRTNKYRIKEIHIVDLEDKNNKKIILYNDIGYYSICIFASGNFFEIKDVMKLLKIQISGEKILKDEFPGDLKPYRHLEQYFRDLDKEFQ